MRPVTAHNRLLRSSRVSAGTLTEVGLHVGQAPNSLHALVAREDTASIKRPTHSAPSARTPDFIESLFK